MKKTYLPPVSQSLYLQMEELIATSINLAAFFLIGDPSSDAEDLIAPGTQTIDWTKE